MGHVAAWAHLRGCGQYGGASVQMLQGYVRAQRWSREADRLGEVAAARMQRAWQVYCRDYDLTLQKALGFQQRANAGTSLPL
jgi:uncharacterized protein (DUF2252 family)